MDDNEKYLRWLEGMWEVQKFDILGNTEHEEERKEEVLEIFANLTDISRRRVEVPYLPSWEPSSPW
ncbi:MAG: hypothetical protein M3305_16615 [Actinomycetota bacterium]|nr:hypothetical protein [Actinomycetota bacterium]